MISNKRMARVLAHLFVSFGWLALLSSGAEAGQGEWKSIDPADIALKTPRVEKDADAEALFWEMRIEKDLERASHSHYLRIKIFNERGRESHSKVELAYASGTQVQDIAARTIKPDGTVVNVTPDAIIDTMVARVGKFKVQAKSFSLPAVEPGAIIEYRWRETHKSDFYSRLHFQRDIPIRSIKCSIKANESSPLYLVFKPFNMEEPTFLEDAKGFRTATIANVPAFRGEPNMAPENEVRRWVLVYYSSPFVKRGNAFWLEHAKSIHESFKSQTKVNDEIRNAMLVAIGDAATPEQKLERIFEFCRTKVKNVSDDASGLTAADLERLKANKSPADTLKRGSGSSYDINMLFAALSTAAGFDARYAQVADRSDIFFDRGFSSDYFLTAYDIAVRIGDKWKLFDPASTHIPYGMLRWQEEGNDALVSDPTNPVFVRTPISPPEKSLTKRTANFRLTEDGILEGDVRVEFSGHTGIRMREAYDQDSPAERERAFHDSLKKQIGALEMSEIKVENLGDPLKPFTLSGRVRVPGYAQRTGKRLFLQPAFFQYGAKPLFSASERRYPVYFHFPWSEEDQVQIGLPAGFELDNADRPSPFAAVGVSEYDVRLQFDVNERTLIFQRKFTFGRNDNILFPAKDGGVTVQAVYPQLKLLFDTLHKADSHIITLRQSTAPSK